MNTKKHDCKECATKHLSQALVLMDEVMGGYKNTDHIYYCIGHLAEASSHLSSTELSNQIRDFRLSLGDFSNISIGNMVQLKDLLDKVVGVQEEQKSTPMTLVENETVVITPTGDRPAILRILKECLERQTIKPRAWVVVDDGVVGSLDVIKDYPSLIYIRRDKLGTGHTLKENMLTIS